MSAPSIGGAAVYLHPPGLVSALGSGIDAHARALFAADHPSGVQSCGDWIPDGPIHLGLVHTALPALDHLPVQVRSRNNALLADALAQIRAIVDEAIQRFGPERIAIVVGTSTSGIGETERAMLQKQDFPAEFHYAQQEMGSPALYLRTALGTAGPAYVISTACSSSAKALAAGARLLRAGIVDAVIAGGADSLCRFTVAGFLALESVAKERCNPMSRNRCGINIGEGAALFLMTRNAADVRLAGWGESSDAHHMSAPAPSGAGAIGAMRESLRRAGIDAAELDYVNLHGTATQLNDAMEARAIHAIGAAHTPCSSTKPLTGHALGAAGAIEAALSWITLAANPDRCLPPHWFDGEFDGDILPLRLVQPGQLAERSLRHILSSSFAFGGSNACLVLSRE